MHESRSTFLAVVLTLALGCAACSGPSLLPDGHLAYNEAVRSSTDRELLLNIVRVRYGDSIEFLSTASINSTVRFNAGLTGGLQAETANNIAGTELTFGYSGGPTFTFVPQRGDDFARSLTTPVDLGKLTHFATSSQDVMMVFRLMVVRMNGLENRLGHVSEEFTEAAKALLQLQRRGDLVVGARPESERVSVPMDAATVTPAVLLDAAKSGLRVETVPGDGSVVFTRPQTRPVLFVARPSEEWSRLASRLQLVPDMSYYYLQPGAVQSAAAHEQDTLSLQTRGLLEVLVYLAQGVDVPFEPGTVELEERAGAERVMEAMEDLFHVECSSSEPDDAFIAVEYRGHWFYVRTDDVRSRRTFFLLATAFRFTLQSSPEAAPGLNLNIGT